jgi:DNA-binding transcriptional regulator YiaG
LRPEWLRVDRLLGEHGVRDERHGRRRFAQNMEAGRIEDAGENQAPALRRGWLVGAEDFLERVLEKVTLSPKVHHETFQRAESTTALARRVVAQALNAAGLKEDDLQRLRKGDPIKVKIARELRDQTTLSLQQIATRLHMGAASHVAHLLYHRKENK